jgi:hypothetical protein
MLLGSDVFLLIVATVIATLGSGAIAFGESQTRPAERVA